MATRHISEYPQLLNTVLSTQKVVYLCGAGASMSLGSHRLSWANWIIEGKKYLTMPEQGELDRRIGSWTSEELIDAATFYWAVLSVRIYIELLWIRQLAYYILLIWNLKMHLAKCGAQEI